MSRDYLFDVKDDAVWFGRIDFNPFRSQVHLNRLPNILLRIPSIGVVNLIGYQTHGFDYLIEFFYNDVKYIGSTMGFPFVTEEFFEMNVYYDDMVSSNGKDAKWQPSGNWIRAYDEISAQLFGRYGDPGSTENAYHKFGLDGLKFRHSAYGMEARVGLKYLLASNDDYWMDRLSLTRTTLQYERERMSSDPSDVTG